MLHVIKSSYKKFLLCLNIVISICSLCFIYAFFFLIILNISKETRKISSIDQNGRKC